MDQFDVLVIGSGPAGAAAAVRARQLRLSVGLVDRRAFPRDKLCGGLFTGRSEKAMAAIFGLSVTDDLFLKSTHMRFSSRDEVLADIPDAPPVYLTMRRDFDAMLHAEAVSAGSTPILGDAIAQIEFGANTITLKSGQTLGYKVLIGADGVNTMVGRLLDGRPFNPDTIGFGLEIETPLTEARDQAVEVNFDAAEWGYGWSFPKKKSITVGVGGINSQNADMKANMAAYVDLTDADADLKYKGHFLPFGDYKANPGRANVLLVGDAAGLVDPITGEGIALALESGAHGAEAAAQALAANDPSAAFADYKRRIRPIQRSLDQAKQWRLIMFPKVMQGSFKKAFKKGSSLQRKYLDLLAGDAEYNDLRWALVRRIPKILWGTTRHHLGRLLRS